MPRSVKIMSISIVGTAFCLLVGCARVAFQGFGNGINQCQTSGQCVVNPDGSTHMDYTVPISAPAADILFVIDNSASMSSIQHGIANRFPNFIQSMSNIDYRIAIATTDVSSDNNGPRAINGNGSLQDGQFIQFSPGVTTLTQSTANAQSLFTSAITRTETLTCEQYLQSHDCHNLANCTDYSNFCPSEDTRAIYAANLAVTRNDPSFFRPNIPLAVVIISNADERASGGRIGAIDMLEPLDQPQSLLANVSQTFSNMTSLSVHSVIIKPGDSSCKAAQTFTDLIFGWEGTQYANASNLTTGAIGSICASDYGQELGQIGTSIASQSNSISLACSPVNGMIQVSFAPSSAAVPYQISGSSSQVLQFSKPVAAGTTVHLIYDCKH